MIIFLISMLSFYNCMLRSLRSHAQHHRIPFDLSPSALQHLKVSNCSFCTSQSPQAGRSYQSVGLRTFSRGFMDYNVFPLCTLCYKTRYGMSHQQYTTHAAAILRHISSGKCKVYRRKGCPNYKHCIPLESQCRLCGTGENLTVDRINSRKCYTNDNVQLLCYACNRMKSNLPLSIFVQHMKNIALM